MSKDAHMEFLTLGIERESAFPAHKSHKTRVIKTRAVDSFDEVVEALINLASRTEVDLLRIASKGGLKELFPFRLRPGHVPDLESWDKVVEAPARSLTNEEYLRFLKRHPIE